MKVYFSKFKWILADLEFENTLFVVGRDFSAPLIPPNWGSWYLYRSATSDWDSFQWSCRRAFAVDELEHSFNRSGDLLPAGVAHLDQGRGQRSPVVTLAWYRFKAVNCCAGQKEGRQMEGTGKKEKLAACILLIRDNIYRWDMWWALCWAMCLTREYLRQFLPTLAPMKPPTGRSWEGCWARSLIHSGVCFALFKVAFLNLMVRYESQLLESSRQVVHEERAALVSGIWKVQLWVKHHSGAMSWHFIHR